MGLNKIIKISILYDIILLQLQYFIILKLHIGNNNIAYSKNVYTVCNFVLLIHKFAIDHPCPRIVM